MSRDSRRSQVYAAEAQLARIVDSRLEYPTIQLFGSEVVVPDDRKFGDLESVQRYVDAVLGLNWVMERWPDQASRPVSVRPRRGARRAHYEPSTATIALPPFEVGGSWGLRELVVLHELAHHLAETTLQDQADDPEPAHGSQFAAAMVTLVGELLGPEAEFLLRTTYLENGVPLH